jgi:Ca2+-binding RTX toxin-like protein
MSLTLEEANRALDHVTTPEQLADLVRRVSVHSEGDTAVFYGSSFDASYSPVGTSIIGQRLARALARDYPSVRVVNNTPAGLFLNTGSARNLLDVNQKFKDKLDSLFENRGGQPAINEFLFGKKDANGNVLVWGLWDTVSANFAASVTGPVRTIIGAAGREKTFAAVELPILLNNPRVTEIDGISTEFLRSLPADLRYPVVAGRSLELSASLKVALGPDGKMIVDERDLPTIDAEEFLSALSPTGPPSLTPGDGWIYLNAAYPRALVAERLQQAQAVYVAAQAAMLAEIARQPAGNTLARQRVINNLHSLGRVCGVLTALMTLGEAAELYSSGQTDAARRLVRDWILDQALAYAGGAAVSPLVAMLVPLGPWGALMGLVLVTAASTGAVAYGDDLLSVLRDKETGGLLGPIARSMDDLMRTAERVFLSPLALDLDGDGVETLGLEPAAIHFDHDADGLAERTGWIAADDGLLVLDHNGDGLIDTGAELFGNNTRQADGSLAAHGFAALAAWDQDGNGRIDSADPVWARLQVWRDADSDARVDAGELQALAALGITSLDLQFRSGGQPDPQGNLHGQLGTYSTTDGRQPDLVDVWFIQNPADTVERQWLPVTASIAALPDLPGAGRVFSLHQAMQRDPEGRLQALVEQWIAADFAQRQLLIDPLLRRWAGVAEAPTPRHLPHISDDRPLAVIEAFRAIHWRQGQPAQNELAAMMVSQSYALLRRRVEDRLTLEVDLAPLLATLAPTAVAAGAIRFDPLVAALLQRWRDGGDPLRQMMIGRCLPTQLPEFLTTPLRAALADAARPLEADAARFLRLTLAETWIRGTDANDTLTGSGVADLLDGGAGADQISGGGGDDTFAGGGGDDALYAGEGTTLLLFAPGDGHDRLFSGQGRQQLLLPPGLGPDQVVLRATTAGFDLVVQVGAAGDTVTVAGFMDNRWEATRPLERLLFADGSAWDWRELQRRLLAGTPADDILRGSQEADAISGAEGNDQLLGGAGDDTLHGGPGDDVLMGEAGSDRYLFAPGFGRDRIFNDDPSPQRCDTIAFEAGITPADVRLERLYNDLLLHLPLSGDTLVVVDYLAQDGLGSRRLDSIAFADGTRWDVATVKAMLIAGTPASQLLIGYDHADLIRAAEGNDTVRGMAGDDDLAGNQGNDRLEGGEGNDTLRGGLGDDRLDGGAGRNLLLGGEGNDTLTSIHGSQGDTLDGWSGDDQLIGGPAADQLRGGVGRDLLRGEAGNDWIDAGLDDDYVEGGAGDDTLIGGGHTAFGDTLAYTDRPAAVRVTLASSAAQDTGGGGMDAISGFENLVGSRFDDLLRGDDGANYIDGRAGADTISGGLGPDLLIGGAGADTFLYFRRLEAGLGASRDVIHDFSSGDRIDLGALDADHNAPGNQAFTFIGAAPFSGTGQLRYTVVAGAGVLEGNLLGSLEADFALQLNGAPSLTAAALVL